MLGMYYPGMGERVHHAGYVLPGYTGRYTTQGIYLTLPPWVYHPPTHGHDSTGVRCVQGVGVCSDDALGSVRELTLGERLSEASLLLFLLGLVGNSAQCCSVSPDENG